MSAKRLSLGLSGLGVAALVYGALGVQAASEGLFSAEQSKRGEAIYKVQCAMCHGTELEGMGQAPTLADIDFIGKYQGSTLDLLFDKVQKTMPATKPGSLTRAQTADVVAFLLSQNSYVAGAAALPDDADSLKKISLDKPAAKKP